MFGMGSIGNFLPMIGSAFGGGGLFSLGFTLLSGLLTNLSSPKNPGFDNFAAHPGFSSGHANPGFGTMGGGPNVTTFGSMSGYFGNNYTADDYSILPQTPSGQYYGNANYSFGNRGVSYSPNAPITYAPQNNHYGHQMGQLQFGGQFPRYVNSYNSVVLPQSGFFPSYQPGQLNAHYGSAPAPYQQSHGPVMSHYGFGSPQQYNPASTLYGHQSGSVQISYNQQSTQRTTYGGPQQDGKTVVHNHFHLHLHNQKPSQEPQPGDYPAEQPAEEPTVAEKPDYGQPKPDPKPDNKPTYGHHHHHHHHHHQVEPETTPDYTPQVEQVDHPAQVVSTNATAAQSIQTSWGRVPHINTEAEWGPASRMVAERITGGDSTQYSFGGRNPGQNADGMMPERMAVWHVFQQNESLRLDLKSGNFYETKSDGTEMNKFHMSAVADIQRQAGNNPALASQMIGDFLLGRNLAADGVVGTGKHFAGPTTTPLSELRPTFPFTGAASKFG